MKSISVIVTCYNHEKYIAQCLESIFRQTYRNIELFVINDGSTDRSDEKIKEILPNSPFEINEYIFQENQGACIARNKGLDWATGEFVLIVDSDNYLDDDHIERCVDKLEEEQADIAYCSMKDADTKAVINEVPEFSLGRLITANYIDTCSLIRATVLKDHRFDIKLNRLFMQDYDFFLGLIHSGAKAVKVDGLYQNYRVLAGSIGNRGDDRDSRRRWIEVYSYINQKYPEYTGNATNLLGSWFLELNNDFELEEKTNSLLTNDLQKLTDQQEDLTKKLAISEEALYNAKLYAIEKEITDADKYKNLDELYLSIVHSKSWKVGRMLTWPYRKILSLKNSLKKQKTNQLLPQSPNPTYQAWIDGREFAEKVYAERNHQSFTYRPLISILIPVYNVEKKWLIQCVNSIKGQWYDNWELCLADDASTSKETIETLHELARNDARIKVVYRKHNGHISEATNSALELATGEFVALVDNDDELSPNALFEVVKVLNECPQLDLIYSDEDKINQYGYRFDPHFKPDWSPDLILNQNYISHLGIYRTELARKIEGFRVGFEGAQDHDFLLRFIEQTNANRIFHIPKVLYHWRAIEGSTALQADEKSYAYDQGVKAVQEALDRRKIKALVKNGKYPGLYDVDYDLIEEALVSIIIPTKNGYEDLKQCIDSIIEKSTYSNYEIIVADNGSDDPKIFDLFSSYTQKLGNRFKHVVIDIPFNYSKINNLAVKESQGKYLLFLNNDTSVISPDWIENMLGFAQFDRIGCVGAKLWYMDDTIQHGGVVLGIGGIAGHSFLNATKDDPGYFSKLYTDYNYTAVTAACLMVSRADFEAVGGFDETLEVAFNDVDFCIRIYQLGRKNVWCHKAELYHYESKSRGYEDTPEKLARFCKEIDCMNERYGTFLRQDPAYNCNFALNATPFSVIGREIQ